MKIKFGAIVTDGRGKLGGHVFSKNNAGAYMRTKVTPNNPQSTRQTSVRNLFSSISQQWSIRTADERAAWNEAVPEWTSTNVFGDIKVPSGKALYQRLNNQARVVGLPAMTTPPARGVLPTQLLQSGSINITAGTLALTGRSFSADVVVVCYATEPVSQGTSFVKNKLRQIYFAPGDVYDAADAYTAYVSKYGVPAVGQKIFVGMKSVIATGQSTVLQSVVATINP